MRTAMNEYPRDCEMWLEALKSKYDGEGKVFGKEEWDQLLGNFGVSTLHDIVNVMLETVMPSIRRSLAYERSRFAICRQLLLPQI